MIENRIYYFDLIKSIAILFVCVYHYGSVNIDVVNEKELSIYFNYFIHGMYSAGVPLFFMVNGGLLLNKNYTIKQHSIRTIYIYILVWFWGMVTLLLVAPKFHIEYSFAELFKNLVPPSQGILNHLWFLLSIVYIYLLFPLIKSLYDKNDKSLMFYLFITIFIFTFGDQLVNSLISIYGYAFGIPSMLNMDLHIFYGINPYNQTFSFSLLYFITGGLLAKNIKSIPFNVLQCVIILFASLLLLFLFGLMQTSINGAVYDTVWQGYASIMTLIMSISFFVLCFRINISNTKALNVIKLMGSNTLGIYFLHAPIGIWLTAYYLKIPFSTSLAFGFLYGIVLLAISLLMTLALKRIPIIRRLLSV